ncbi:MAG: hypothetical protein RMJ66_08450 [Bacteroidia bacterium]|nr:hypothetical protein [Bacteroidia bacterium]MDW8135078.1 hypothetical protein [Bacteroidia bacterium]
MRNIVLALMPLLGVTWMKAEGAEVRFHNSLTGVHEVLVGPRKNWKNYRTRLAQTYFGGGGKCRNWKRFCGR